MDRCEDHDKIIANAEKNEEKLNNIDKTVARMEVALTNAIKETTGHITAGSRWRATIVIACIGLIGSILGAVVRFSVMEYRVTKFENTQGLMQTQIMDLNFEKGRAVGIEEGRKNGRSLP